MRIINKVALITYTSLALISQQSCGNSENGSSDAEYLEKTCYYFKANDTINLPINTNLRYNSKVDVIKVNNERFFEFVVHRKNKHILYDYNTRSFYKEIKYDFEGPNSIGTLMHAVIHNWDSIFTVSYSKRTVSLVDSSGALKQNWVLNKTSRGDEISGIAASSWNNPLKYFDKKLYLRKISPYKVYMKSFYEDPQLITFDFNTNSIHNYGEFPEVYLKGVYFGDYNLSMDRIIKRNTDIVMSYSLSHYIYVYRNERFYKKYNLKSKYVPEFPENPAVDLATAGWEKNENYEVPLASYRYIRYDPYRDLIYRVVLHTSDIYDGSGNKIEVYDKPFSIQIIDAIKFELISEVDFPGNTYDLKNIIPVEEGLLMSTCNGNNPDLQEDRMQFVLYELIQKGK